MKLDMHCHTKEGSIDGRLGIVEYARMLKDQGFDGMLVTDHNSFGGYEAYKQYTDKPKELDDFVVLKGIEYDSRDGGHVLVIMPDGAYTPFLEKRGMHLQKLASLVHEQGGIIGAAHPYGYGTFAITNTKLGKKNPDIVELFDFIETYNSGIPTIYNEKAKKLAEKYHKPATAGSDAHERLRVGTAYTIYHRDITCNNDLIEAIKTESTNETVGKFYYKLLHKRSFGVKWAGIVAYWVYNKASMVAYTHARTKAFQKLDAYKKKTQNQKVNVNYAKQRNMPRKELKK